MQSFSIKKPKPLFVLRLLPYLLLPIGIFNGGLASFAQELPNIIIIYTDDLGYGDLSCYNDSSAYYTPNIDRMAAQGVRFTDAHSPSTICSPSRYGLYSGQQIYRSTGRGGGAFEGPGGPSYLKPGTLIMLNSDNGAETVHVDWMRQDYNHDATDSYDILPAMLGIQDENETMKKYALPETASDATGQLFNLASDPGETTNLFFTNPEKRKELQDLLQQLKSSGRSAPNDRIPLGIARVKELSKPEQK